ncbi:MAG: hypothetical protein ACLTW9_09030 [Enterocloster sp.]
MLTQNGMDKTIYRVSADLFLSFGVCRLGRNDFCESGAEPEQ